MIDYTLSLDELPDPLPIEPLTKPFNVTMRPPGSKSITCRAYVLAALAKGESKIIRPLRADDTDRLLDALCTLGAEARWQGEDVFIKGVGGRFPRGGEVNLGDGGTPARFMIAVACLAAEPVVVDGSARMRERPIAEGVELLRTLGASIKYVEATGRLPVRVTPSESFRGGALTIGETMSSQFLSALLLISPWLPENVDLVYERPPTSEQYLALTCDVLEAWDVAAIIFEENWDDMDRPYFERHAIESGPLKPCVYEVEPDASSAAYFATAATICRNCMVRLDGLDERTEQPDGLLILDALPELGADVREATELGEALIVRGTAPVNADRRTSFHADRMPDGSLCLAVAAARVDGPTTITGLRTLRVKETDRIAALANELAKIGCDVNTTGESITIMPPRGQDLRADDPVAIETYNDHRMAMAFAVLGLARPGISIRNPKCVMKSYPGFWKDFAKLYQP